MLAELTEKSEGGEGEGGEVGEGRGRDGEEGGGSSRQVGVPTLTFSTSAGPDSPPPTFSPASSQPSLNRKFSLPPRPVVADVSLSARSFNERMLVGLRDQSIESTQEQVRFFSGLCWRGWPPFFSSRRRWI